MTETEYIDHLIGIGVTAEHVTSLAREREREVHELEMKKLEEKKNAYKQIVKIIKDVYK